MSSLVSQSESRSGWRRVRLDHVAHVQRNPVDPKSLADDLVHYYSIPALEETGEAATTPPSRIESGKLKLVGDEVLISKLNPRKARVVEVQAHPTLPILCSGEFVALQPKDGIDRRFLYWLLTSEKTRQDLNGAVQSVTRSHQRVRPEEITKMRVNLPSVEEQRAIAHFLDRETARIDALIERKQRMIEVLREGIVVEVEQRLRESATSEIPFRRLLVEPPQYGAGESGEVGEESWPRYIRITDLTADGALRDDDVRRLPPDIARHYLLTEGDLLFARSGATVGKAFIYRESMGPSCFAGYLIRFRVDRARIAPDLVEAWTRTGHYWGQIRASSLQATIENVSAERYKDLLIPVPSKHNQTAILKSLDLRRERARRLEHGLHGQLTLLQEHRQALVTAAVTGQLDISSAA